MKEFIEDIIVYVIFAALLYGAFSLATVATGMVHASEINNQQKGKIPCLEQPTNFEMLFPAYKLGCWIGAKQGEKYYWSKE